MPEAASPPKEQEAIEVRADSLPLSCPRPGETLATMHPRVYIPLKESGGRAVCPYCSREFILKD